MFIQRSILTLSVIFSYTNIASMHDKPLINLAILVSGAGTNMAAIVDAHIENAKPCVVISNRQNALALLKAQQRGIPAVYLPSKKNEDYSQQLIECLQQHNVTPENGLICLAGFMKILDKKFVTTFKNRILNIHPSLLPAFPGLDAIGQALKAGVVTTGCTVHLVDEGVDTGPILQQASVGIDPNDSSETLAAKIHEQEHKLYPAAIEKFVVKLLEQ